MSCLWNQSSKVSSSLDSYSLHEAGSRYRLWTICYSEFYQIRNSRGKCSAEYLAHVKSSVIQDQIRVPATLGTVQDVTSCKACMLDSSPRTITIPRPCGDIWFTSCESRERVAMCCKVFSLPCTQYYSCTTTGTTFLVSICSNYTCSRNNSSQVAFMMKWLATYGRLIIAYWH